MLCPNCGISYGDFKTGYTYDEVYQMFWVSEYDSSKWKYKRRNTILGKWHQIKQEMWAHHLESCGEINERSKTQTERNRSIDY